MKIRPKKKRVRNKLLCWTIKSIRGHNTKLKDYSSIPVSCKSPYKIARHYKPDKQ